MISEMEIVPIWSSMGNRTIKVVIKTDKGVYSSSSPTLLDTGKNEPRHLEVRLAVKKFQEIKKEFIGMDECDYDIIDDKLEKLGFNKIGANISSCISKVCVKAGGRGCAYKIMNPEVKKFPVLMAPVISGGIHGGYCSIRNFFVFSRAETIYEAIEENNKFWKDIGEILKKRGMILGRSSEGSWIVHFTDLKTIDFISFHASRKNMGIGVDFGGSELYKNGRYVYDKIGKKFDVGEQLEFVRQMVNTFNITYVQDPFHSNDFKAFAELRKKLKRAIIIGSDLYSSQSERVKRGFNYNSTDGVNIKIEQAGTVSRVVRLTDLLKDADNTIVISDRSEETDDDFLADLAVGIGADILKYGISGGEHISKINRLVEIWFDVAAKDTPNMAKLKI